MISDCSEVEVDISIVCRFVSTSSSPTRRSRLSSTSSCVLPFHSTSDNYPRLPSLIPSCAHMSIAAGPLDIRAPDQASISQLHVFTILAPFPYLNLISRQKLLAPGDDSLPLAGASHITHMTMFIPGCTDMRASQVLLTPMVGD